MVSNAIWKGAERMCPGILLESGQGEARESDILRKHFLGKMRGSGKMSLEMQAGDVRVSTTFTVAQQDCCGVR